MLPIYKWTGGKRKEIKIFKKYFPEYVKQKNEYLFIEPFFGAGAVYWYLENSKNIINDIDFDLINFLRVVKYQPNAIINMCADMSEKISDITRREKDGELSIADAKKQRGAYYYQYRDLDKNNGLDTLSGVDRAFRFYLVNQFAFNGMRRFNSKGEFNIPYGNYKSFNLNMDDAHVELLNKTEIYCGSYKDVMLNNDNENTFIFIDPPYTREFKEYSHENVFGENEQLELFDVFKSMKKANVMIIINKDDFTENLYTGYIKDEYDLKYSTNIKNRYDNAVKHIIICNY